MKTTQTWFLAVICLSILTACGPKAKLTSSWIAAEFETYKAKDVLVIAVIDNKTSRNLYEKVFVEQLSEHNIHSMASNIVIGDLLEPKQEKVEAAIKGTDAASVLITRVVDSSTESHTYPGTIHFTPGGYYGSMYGYYGHTYNAVYTPPLNVNRTIVKLESNLYDVQSTNLVWSAQSLAIDPNLLREDFERIIILQIKDLQNKGVIQ